MKYLINRASAISPREDLDELIKSKKKLRIKLGIDPTAPDVTLGWYAILRSLRKFQELGHTAVLILGEFTAQVGDPSGKSETRVKMKEDDIDKNSEGVLPIIQKILFATLVTKNWPISILPFLSQIIQYQKNIINDEEIKGIKIRFQKVDGLQPKELRKLVDNGKKDLGEGIVVVFASKNDKVGVAVGITEKLTSKFDAVNFVKLSSEIIGGQGGGGRKDFAQAGGQDQSKINEAFKKIKSLI